MRRNRRRTPIGTCTGRPPVPARGMEVDCFSATFHASVLTSGRMFRTVDPKGNEGIRAGEWTWPGGSKTRCCHWPPSRTEVLRAPTGADTELADSDSHHSGGRTTSTRTQGRGIRFADTRHRHHLEDGVRSVDRHGLAGNGLSLQMPLTDAAVARIVPLRHFGLWLTLTFHPIVVKRASLQIMLARVRPATG